MLLAAQALTMTSGHLSSFHLGRGTAAAYAEIRLRIPACLHGDRWFHADIETALAFVIGGTVRKAVLDAVGTFLPISLSNSDCGDGCYRMKTAVGAGTRCSSFRAKL
mmetsp:Transcript_19608/g.49984  ORF Transcript_19608/g.49984 Transcript_19608/m.49984 type:complete len:107 (-) Transcript_19608:154-474(-)